MKHLTLILLVFLLLSTRAHSGSSTPLAPEFHQSGAFLGIYSGYMSEDKAEILGFDHEYGSYVTRVIPNTAAANAGIQPFDYIVGVNNRQTDEDRNLTDLLDEFRPGDEVTIHFVRKGKTTKARAVLTSRNQSGYYSHSESEQSFLGVSPLDDNRDDQLGVQVEIVKRTTAEELGLRTGDLITSINGYPMVDWSDITTAIDNTPPGQTIEVAFIRDGQKMKVEGKTRSRTATVAYQETFQPAFLGIQSTNITEEKARKLGFDQHYGSYVTSVIKGTAAEKAGLQPFDYIIGIDNYRTGENQSLSQIIPKFGAGDKATIHLVRQGKKKEVPITFGTRTDAERTYATKCDQPFFGVRHSHKAQSDQGVGVTIVSKSTAEALGMIDNDLITAINGQTMVDWQDISTAIDNLRVGETITVDFLRDGRKRSGSQPIKSYCDTPGAEDRDDRYDYDYNYDDQFWSGGRERSRPGGGMDLTRAKIRFENLADSDRNNLRQAHDVELSTANDLRIEGLQLIPNPGSGLFNLQFNLPGRGQTSIRIFNASGRQIYNYELGNYSGEFSDEVDISQNGTGEYFLEIRQDKKTAARKILLSQD